MTSSTSPIASPPSPSRPGDEWFYVGLASSFPNITDSSEKYFKLAWPQPLACRQSGPPSSSTTKVPGCKVFHPPSSTAKPIAQTTTPTTTTSAREIDMDSAVGEDAWVMKEQVMVFRYKDKFHAVDHACPHRTYSMSWAQPFDIEDAGRGVVLGTGIRCRGHGYAFELSTGIGDRGDYRLGVWEVELRRRTRRRRSMSPSSTVSLVSSVVGIDGGGGGPEGDAEGEDEEIWVRRRRQAGQLG